MLPSEFMRLPGPSGRGRSRASRGAVPIHPHHRRATHRLAGIGRQPDVADDARALGLDFIPVVTEQYDLVIPEIYFESENIQILLETIDSSEFKNQVESLGGYSTKRTGQVIL